MRYPDLKRYIIASWGKAVTEKKDGDLVLPYSFVPPCIDGHFRVLFYWDTYFTNLGLIIDGKTDLAKNNVENLFFGIDTFGCVPNYLREDGAKWCSQPPLLTLMVQDIFSATNDEKWLEKAVSFIEKEYSFWMSERITPIGLNQYGSNEKKVDDLVGYYNYVSENRISLPNLSDKEKAKKAIDFISEAESGEDFTPRYDDHRASEYVQIDLNAHLYGVERFLTDYYADKDGGKRALYQKASEKRLFLINKYCYDEKTSLYFDYNYVIEKLNNKICAACFLPFFYGIPENGRELSTLYAKLKTNGGVYNHGVAFKIASDCVRGSGDDAYNTLKMMFYDNPDNPDNGVEPYMLSNMYIGPECPYKQMRGFAPMSGNTGTAPWIYMDMTEYILGVIPDFDGLKIQPCFPKNWDNVKVKRIFRGNEYEIEFVKGDKDEIVFDGQKIEGTVLPIGKRGSKHKVLVYFK